MLRCWQKPDALLKRAATILTADPRELTGLHIGPCRYCHGRDHDYQWRTEREWLVACEDAAQAQKPRPDSKGGFGYNSTKRPNPDCPECDGLGVPYAWFADTRDLSPDAQILFEGVKQTKNGMEIMQVSKAKAFDLLASHYGLTAIQHEHAGKNSKLVEAFAKVRIIVVPTHGCPDGTSRELQRN